MIHPLNHEQITANGWSGLGDAPAQTLAAYIYYINELIQPSLRSIDHNLPIHDRLLEATLVIFDAMLPDKLLLARLYPELRRSPCVITELQRIIHGFFSRLFVHIGINNPTSMGLGDLASMTYGSTDTKSTFTSNILNEARLYVYIGHYVHWMTIWLSDNTPDQSLTLATIDQQLIVAKEWKDWLSEKTAFAQSF